VSSRDKGGFHERPTRELDQTEIREWTDDGHSGTPEMVEIAVSDTGVGIAPADQARVFEEFRQVGSEAQNRQGTGTGLGLTLTRKFIELHGGRIWVTSEVGKGSTFTFTLPNRLGH
jgi:signal transduction histidine kinase